MSALTFSGFLNQEVKRLSVSGSGALRVMAREAEQQSPRLRAPLAVRSIMRQQGEKLHECWAGTNMAELYGPLLTSYDPQRLLSGLERGDPELPHDVLKLWVSFVSERDRFKREAEIKTKLYPYVVQARAVSAVSVYQASKDLGLNQSNICTWLRTADPKYVTIDGARNLLLYFQQHAARRCSVD